MPAGLFAGGAASRTRRTFPLEGKVAFAEQMMDEGATCGAFPVNGSPTRLCREPPYPFYLAALDISP